MSSEWQTISLREAGVSLIDCDHRTPPAAESGYPYVAIPQLKQGRIDLTDVRRINREHFIEWTRKANPKPYDVVLSRRCNPGESAFVPMGLEFALGQNLVLLRADGTKVFPPFLRWLVRSPAWWEQVETFINVGAVFDSLRCADIPNFRLPIPPYHQQKAIATVLGELDEKIELSRRMDATLEQMAQALFKSWFVDFDFPGFDGNLIDGLPKGWKKVKLEELIDTVSITHKFPTDQVIFLNTSDILDGQVLHNRCSKVSSLPGQAKKSIRKHDILYSEIRPANRRYAYVDFDAQDYVVSTKLMVLRAKSYVDPIVIYYHLKRDEVVSWLQILAESRSGTFPQITFQQVKDLEMIVPDEESLHLYTENLKAYFEKVNSNHRENNRLSETRDALLPRLISGQLRVPDAEKMGRGV